MTILQQYWPIIIAAIGGVVWLIRLEGKVKKNEDDINEFKTDSKEETREVNRKLDAMNTKLTDLCVSIGELTGYMKGRECKE